MKFYEITDPVTGFVHVHGSNMESEGEIRKEWMDKLGEKQREVIAPRDIRVRLIPRNELAVPEQEDEYRTAEEMEEIYRKHRQDKIGSP